jgi:hypothetical protein
MLAENKEIGDAPDFRKALQAASDMDIGIAIASALSALTDQKYDVEIRLVDYFAFESRSPFKRPVRMRFIVSAGRSEKTSQTEIDALSAIDDMTLSEEIAAGISARVGAALGCFVQRKIYLRSKSDRLSIDVCVLLGASHLM